VKPYIAYGWFQRGSRPVVKYLYKRKEKFCVLGALSTDSFVYQITEENINSDIFEEFVAYLIEKFGKIVIVMDQAKYHTSYQMQDFYEQNAENLHVEYFPSYSPELDPTEQVWRKTKKWLAVRFWQSKAGLKDQLVLTLDDDSIMVPIYDYLLP
jgi:transposase